MDVLSEHLVEESKQSTGAAQGMTKRKVQNGDPRCGHRLKELLLMDIRV